MRFISQSLAAFYLAGSASAKAPTTEDGITVECNDDGTLDIKLEYERSADILEFTYGDCTKTSGSVRGLTQDANTFDWDISVNQTACNTGNELRSLSYNQTIDVRVGRLAGSGKPEITFATFNIDSFCVYESQYSVKFNYGTLSTDSHEFDEAGGDVNITFEIQSMDSSFSNSAVAPTTGGSSIYLQLRVTSDHIDDFADKDGDNEGKQYVITKCVVEDTKNSLSYTLWESQADQCTNTDINLDVAYDWTNNVWNFSHTLFLLGTHRESSFELDCSVTVCDAADDAQSTCDKVFNITKCNGDISFSSWTNDV